MIGKGRVGEPVQPAGGRVELDLPIPRSSIKSGVARAEARQPLGHGDRTGAAR